MKIKKGFFVRKVGNEYMAVPVGKTGTGFSGLIRLNGAGQYLWKELEKETTEDELVAKMMERYTGLDEETARTDLREFLETIKVALEY